MKILFVFIAFICFKSIIGFGQPEMYSQFYGSDLRLNPALTGMIHRDWQICELYQGNKNNNDLKTSTNCIYAELAYDIIKTKGRYGMVIKEKSNTMFGIGLMNEFRNSGNSDYNFMSNFFSIAIHRRIFNSSNISIGIQPGMVKTNSGNKFDMNFGVLYGFQKHDCWIGDQVYKYQAGVSLYSYSQPFHSTEDTLYIKPKHIQAHAGALINIGKKFGIVPRAYYLYEGDHHYSGGATFVFRKHYSCIDRIRAGLHYLSSEHLVCSGGFRLYTRGKNSSSHDNRDAFAVDLCFSYDLKLDMIGLESGYKNGFEINIILYPITKCWEMSKCAE